MDQSHSILIIEDNPGDQILLEENIKSTKLVISDIIIVDTLTEAISLLKQKSFSLIFLDLFLPDSTGLDSFTELLEANSKIPIIISSGLSDSQTAVRAITLGAQDFLIKGDYDNKMLEKTIRYSIERKRNLDIIEESNERFNLVSMATNDMVWDWDIITGDVYRNKERWVKIFKTENKLPGNTPDDFERMVHPEDRVRVEKILQKLLYETLDENLFEAEFRVLRDDGSYAFIYDRGYIIRNEEGKPLRAIGASQDITERKIAEQKVILSEQRFKSLVQNGSDIIGILDQQGNYLYLSESVKNILGFEPAFLLGKNALSYIHPDDIEQAGQALVNLITAKHLTAPPHRFLNSSGEWRWMESTISYFIDDPAVNGIVVNSKDITDKKIAEEEVALEKIMKQKEITEAVIAAQESERSEIGRELHDNVNQLLGATRLYIDMARRDEVNRDSLLLSSSTYTLQAIDEIRKLSKTLITPLITEIGLVDIIKDLSEDIMLVHPIKINLSIKDFTEKVLNEKFKLNLFRIVQEQLNNILKHAKAATVQIRFLQTADEIELLIIDDGVGFDTLTRKKGVGLINIKSRVELYKGILNITSEPGHGCALSAKFIKSELLF